MPGSWHELRRLAVLPSQAVVWARLLDGLAECRLPHLDARQERAALDGGQVALELPHARRHDVRLRIVLRADGSGWIECDALDEELQLMFGADEPAHGVEAALLILHGWATATLQVRDDGRLGARVTIDRPDGGRFHDEVYEPGWRDELGSRTVSWGDGRVPPPRRG